MATGLFQPLRLYEYSATKPELSNNDFYCKDYDHDEYIVLPSTANKLLPFIIVFKAANPALSFVFTSTAFKLVCSGDGSETEITVDTDDFTDETNGSDRFLIYSAATAFTAAEEIKPGRYHLVIEDITFGTNYSYYSDTFIIKQFINGTP
jgi:hypothetical protein